MGHLDRSSGLVLEGLDQFAGPQTVKFQKMQRASLFFCIPQVAVAWVVGRFKIVIGVTFFFGKSGNGAAYLKGRFSHHRIRNL